MDRAETVGLQCPWHWVGCLFNLICDQKSTSLLHNCESVRIFEDWGIETALQANNCLVGGAKTILLQWRQIVKFITESGKNLLKRPPTVNCGEDTL